MQYVIKKLGECKDNDRISVDPDYTVASLAALISAHNSGALNIEDECWFGVVDCYQFAPKDAPTLVSIQE